MLSPLALALSRRLAWPHGAQEWAIMEELGELYILGNHNRLWATSLITNVSANWFDIGMVLVDPSFRKRGTGSLITKVSMDEVASDGAVISLTSSLEAKRVYRNLDFVEIGSMINMHRLNGTKKINPGGQMPKNARS
jgi:GNAT superfamily N-acetyltransferase